MNFKKIDPLICKVMPLLLCCMLLASCNASSPASNYVKASAAMPQAPFQVDSTAIDRLVVTTGCGKASSIAPGTSADVTIEAHPRQAEGYTTRSYRVHVPTGYITDHPVPVLLVFHGHGGNAAGMESTTGFSKLADQQNFIAVYPQGLPDGAGGVPFWASIGPYDYGIDDALFVSDVLNKLQSEFCIDAHRIYVTGFSNGGGMSAYLHARSARGSRHMTVLSGKHPEIVTKNDPTGVDLL